MNNAPSFAAQIMITIIPIVGIVFGCTVIFFYIYFGHQAKMLMIEKGTYQRPLEKFDLESFSLFFGLLSFCIGIGMSLFFLMREGISYGLLGGLIPLSVGAGLITFFIVRVKMNKKRDG
jgi:hypothetical protein